MSMYGLKKGEPFVRLAAVLTLVLTACLVGFDSQSKHLFFGYRKATVRDLDALLALVYVTSVAAGYNFLQLIRNCWMPAGLKGDLKGSNLCLLWLCFLLDQIAVYVTFGANSAAAQASFLAVTGAEEFQWMKLCDKYTRFCIQIGGSLVCGYVACILMALVSFISAFNLFRLYSPKNVLRLKIRGPQGDQLQS